MNGVVPTGIVFSIVDLPAAIVVDDRAVAVLVRGHAVKRELRRPDGLLLRGHAGTECNLCDAGIQPIHAFDAGASFRPVVQGL